MTLRPLRVLSAQKLEASKPVYVSPANIQRAAWRALSVFIGHYVEPKRLTLRLGERLRDPHELDEAAPA